MTSRPAELVRCRATKQDGTPCGVSWGLSPDTQLCLVHDPQRKAAADAARAAGGTTTGQLAAKRNNGKYRALDPQQLRGRPARTKREIERNLAVMAFAEGTGAADPVTCREYVRISLAHKTLINERTLTKDVAMLKRQVKAMKRGRSA